MSGINLRKERKGRFTRSMAKYFLPSAIALCITTICKMATPSVLQQNAASLSHSFPGMQDFLHQSKQAMAASQIRSAPLKEEDEKPSYEESEFSYGNKTYKYRYSKKLLSKFTTTQQLHEDLPSIVFGVCANSKKPSRRNAIRNSWARDALLFFIVAGDWEEVYNEFYRTGDLLWVGAPENYRDGLTPKTFGFLHFGSTQLDQKHQLPWDYIFKTDDDVFVNVTHLRTELSEFENPKADYYGLFKNGTKPSREPGEDKWFLSREAYPDDYFPQYAPGVGYALSQKFARCASSTMSQINEMPWEDVATGMLAQKCSVPLSSANDNWAHFPEELDRFPQENFLKEGYLAKIHHKVSPWFQSPLHEGKSLYEGIKYKRQKIIDAKNRRAARNKKQQRRKR